MLAMDPGGSPADAIGSRADHLAIFPITMEWLVVADRDADLAWVWSTLPIKEDVPFPHFMTKAEWAESVRESRIWQTNS
jgi:hypothetical protein